MVLTTDFKEGVMARAKRDGRFRRALLTEAVQELVSGDAVAGKAVLRDYINATMGFGPLAEEMDANVKSLHRMLGPRGNPTMENLRAILRVLQEHEGIEFAIRSRALA
ncbi:MAG: helix-turn-helix domain-containing transcriptional regulator [Gammaproteobacteria bacterium]